MKAHLHSGAVLDVKPCYTNIRGLRFTHIELTFEDFRVPGFHQWLKEEVVTRLMPKHEAPEWHTVKSPQQILDDIARYREWEHTQARAPAEIEIIIVKRSAELYDNGDKE